jgi:hypothetical protein
VDVRDSRLRGNDGGLNTRPWKAKELEKARCALGVVESASKSKGRRQ